MNGAQDSHACGDRGRRTDRAVVVVPQDVQDTNAEPYMVDGAELTGWTLALEDPGCGRRRAAGAASADPADRRCVSADFHRSGVSLAGPARPGCRSCWPANTPLGERCRHARGDAELARTAGLEKEAVVPVCMGGMRDPSSGPASQRFFLVFESPGVHAEFARNWRGCVRRAAPRAFDPAALRPIVPVASFEPDFHRWWPFQGDPARDCQTALVVRSP